MVTGIAQRPPDTQYTHTHPHKYYNLRLHYSSEFDSSRDSSDDATACPTHRRYLALIPPPPVGLPHRLGLPMVVCVECMPADKPWNVMSATRRSSGVAPRACVRVCWCRRIFTYINTLRRYLALLAPRRYLALSPPLYFCWLYLGTPVFTPSLDSRCLS